MNNITKHNLKKGARNVAIYIVSLALFSLIFTGPTAVDQIKAKFTNEPAPVTVIADELGEREALVEQIMAETKAEYDAMHRLHAEEEASKIIINEEQERLDKLRRDELSF